MVISLFPWEIVMLEKYYIRPTTIDRIHKSWIASAVEQYVSWMAERRYTDRSVSRRIPLVLSFGEFAKAHGASEIKDPTQSRRAVRASVDLSASWRTMLGPATQAVRL